MKIKANDIWDILEKDFQWQKVYVDIHPWIAGKQITVPEPILKHPTKKLYFRGGRFGKQYRIYRGYQIDITHVYYECSYSADYEYNATFGTITLDDFLCINLR